MREMAIVTVLPIFPWQAAAARTYLLSTQAPPGWFLGTIETETRAVPREREKKTNRPRKSVDKCFKKLILAII